MANSDWNVERHKVAFRILVASRKKCMNSKSRKCKKKKFPHFVHKSMRQCGQFCDSWAVFFYCKLFLLFFCFVLELSIGAHRTPHTTHRSQHSALSSNKNSMGTPIGPEHIETKRCAAALHRPQRMQQPKNKY